jgi:hypothetical protein
VWATILDDEDGKEKTPVNPTPPWGVPEIRVAQHSVLNASSNVSIRINAIHLSPIPTEAFGVQCPAEARDAGGRLYLPVIIPCVEYEPGTTPHQQRWQAPEAQKFVSSWLTNVSTQQQQQFNTLYLIPIIGGAIVVIVAFIACLCWRRNLRARRQHKGSTGEVAMGDASALLSPYSRRIAGENMSMMSDSSVFESGTSRGSVKFPKNVVDDANASTISRTLLADRHMQSIP